MKRSLQLNPDHRPATWAQVKHWRDTHEIAPVSTTFGLFDCDERSEARLVQALEEFVHLTTVMDGKLTWKRADNTPVALTQTELSQAYAEVKRGRAVRAAQLHAKAEAFRQMNPPPTVTQLKVLDFWLN